MGDNYLSAKIMLPRGGTMVKGRVAARKRGRDGNPIGFANPNPILDTRSYIVHFDDGDQTELTANMIAQSMYSQCDTDGYEYSLLDKIDDHRCTDTAIKLACQQPDLPAAFYHRLAIMLSMEGRFILLGEPR
jgi:hypothetical protein